MSKFCYKEAHDLVDFTCSFCHLTFILLLHSFCSFFLFFQYRFGPGPHHVRFTVLLPSEPEARPRHFVVECAPLDLMPHAVHLFLEQVMHGLWNNAWFYLNGPHVLQGGPQAQDGEEEGGSSINRFKNLNLDTLAFPEYSPEYPHVQVRRTTWDTMIANQCMFLTFPYFFTVHSRLYWSSRWTRLLH